MYANIIYSVTASTKLQIYNFRGKQMSKFKYFLAAMFIMFSFTIFSSAQTETKKNVSNFDADLAKKFGADDYGMKQYVFVILKTGAAKIDDAETRKKLQSGHMENIGRLATAGKLVLAGPFMEGGNMRGLYIFNVTTIEEAKELVKTDPAIREGLFDVEFTKWYGSAALMNVNDLHKKVQKKSF